MTVRVITGDCREVLRGLAAGSVHCVVTSPPYYGLRDYGVAGQIGLEASPDEYIATMVGVFREVRRVLRDDGTLWLNLGDSYSSGGRASRAHDEKLPARRMDIRPASDAKPKDLLMIPARVALALQADGWWVRSDIIWHKPNPMPESVTDRPTSAHEHVFLLSKAASTSRPHNAPQLGPRTVQGTDAAGGQEQDGGWNDELARLDRTIARAISEAEGA